MQAQRSEHGDPSTRPDGGEPSAVPDTPSRAQRPAVEDSGDERWEETRALARELDRIAKMVERMNLSDYLGLLQRPGRLLWLNFLVGLSRGLGTILGATVLVYVLVAVMQRIIASHFPGLGSFLEEFVHILQQQPARGG